MSASFRVALGASLESPRGIVLPAEVWRTRETAHRARVAPLAEEFLRRRSSGGEHPVWDFLFTYYFFSPGKLMTWCPAVGDLEVGRQGIAAGQEGVAWEWPSVSERGATEARWIARLCDHIIGRPARFACHGLHEWAMVYRQAADRVRHQAWKLRLTPDDLAAFVESQSLCCTHYDAFRFFTTEARPLNAHEPRLETRLDLEQGGCLHANMDLYKWASRLWPWIGSDLVADAFEVAVAGRELDMRASPYDLRDLGFVPVKIETEAGREEYRVAQERLAALAAPVRRNLREAALRIAALEVS